MVFVRSLLLVLLSLMGAEAFTMGQPECHAKNNIILQSTQKITAASFQGRLNKDDKASTRIRMSMRSSQKDEETVSSFIPVSIPYAAALVVFLGFATFVAPGSFGSDADNSMLQAYIDNPVSPGLNEIFNTEFNLLGIIPIVMACLIFPQAAPGGLPPTPFVAASAALGYFGLAPYMIFRKTPRDSVANSDLGWVVRNVLENKLFNWAIVALCLYQYGLAVDPPLTDFDTVWQGFVDLVSTSKFASVSTMDLAILSLTAASLIPLDLKYRNVSAETTRTVAISSLVLPILGAALYCALRPNLPEE